MHRLLIMGAGKIGSLIAFLLAHSNQYTVFLADTQKNSPHLKKLKKLPNIHYEILEAENDAGILAFIKTNHIQGIVSALPFHASTLIADIAAKANCHYFDLTEDTKAVRKIRDLANHSKKAFVPQCGLAPGFISITTHHLMKNFPTLHTVKMRVGALPVNISNTLQYALTWSTDGLINEYGNLCHAIEYGKTVTSLPLEGLEEIKIDGVTYEAFNTSGGVGSLIETYAEKVTHLSYKTIRYPGHCEKIKFLMNDLNLNQDRKTLKKIFEHAIPHTYQDVVLIYISVNGLQHDQFIEQSYVQKFYPEIIQGEVWSAIQLTTASEVCAIIDLVFNDPDRFCGFIKQESFSLEELLHNQFGKYFNGTTPRTET